MAVGLGQQQVVAYRPSLALPSLPLPAESATIIADSNQLPFVHRHWLARIANHAADPHLGNISRRFAVHEFCASSGTASPVSISRALDNGSDDDDDEALAAAQGLIAPLNVTSRRDEPVAGIARLINAWNPKMTLKPSRFKESAVDAPHKALQQGDTEDLSPPRKFLPPRPQDQRKLQFRVCSSCGERHTPQWRGGPFGSNTLCNVCGLLYAKRQNRAGKSRSRRTTRRRRHKVILD